MSPYKTLILKGWWVVLLVLLVAAIVLGRHVPDLEVTAGTSVLMNYDDPDLAYYESTRPMWGYDEYAIICVTRDDWFTAEGVDILKQTVALLGESEHVDSIVSILDIPLLRQEPGPAFNPANIPNLASAEVNLERAKEELLGHTQAAGNLISEDGRSLGILIYVRMPEDTKKYDPEWSALRTKKDKTPEDKARVKELRVILEAASKELTRRRTDMVTWIREAIPKIEHSLEEPVRISGTSFINITLMEHLDHDLEVFGIAAFLLFILCFALVYRRARFVVMPILTCLLPVVLVLGTMSLLEMKLTIVTANLPVLLFTLMLPYTVYFSERYRERRSLFPNEPNDESTHAAAHKVWTPCLFSCATTVAGFMALMTSRTKPVHDFGLMTACGMTVGLFIVFIAIPSMSKPLKGLRVESTGLQLGSTKLVRLFQWLALKKPGMIVICSFVLLGLSIWGASKLSAQSKFTEYFKSGSDIHKGLEYIDNQMGGTTPLEIMLTSEKPNFFITPEGLETIEAAQAYLGTVPEAGNVRSIATLVDELEKKNPNVVPMLPFFSRLPIVRAVTSELADETYTTTRILVRFRETAESLDRNVILDGLRAHLAAQPQLEGLKEVRITGVFLLYANMLNTLMDTQRETFLYVVIAVFLMLMILFRAPILALLLLLTQVLPAIVMLGLMGWMGVPLDMITVMIASIAMGIGIDAAIQYTFRYRRELMVDGDHRAAVTRAHATIGRAIWIATSVIIVGFCVLTLSNFKPSIYFGLFTAIAMLMSQLAALTILPAIFVLTKQPKRPSEDDPHIVIWR